MHVGEATCVIFFFAVGKGTGPTTFALLRSAVLIMVFVAISIILLSYAQILILIFCFDVSFLCADELSITPSPEAAQTIEEKKANINDLNQQIQVYQKKIEEAQSQAVTLETELDLLQNRIGRTELQIRETTAQIDLINSEIVKIQQNIFSLRSARGLP